MMGRSLRCSSPFCLLRRSLLLLAVLVAAPLTLHAQSADTLTVSLLRGERLDIGTLLQADASFNEPGRTDGFEARVARLRLGGTVERARFFVQADFIDSPSVLDLRLRVPLHQHLTLRAGLYKSPFSHSLITFRGVLPLAERPRVVNALAPQRQIGGHLTAALVPDRLSLEIGLFNGNGDAIAPNDNNAFLYVGRVTATHVLSDARIQVGVNAGYSQDADVDLRMTADGFSGDRLLLGGDLTVTAPRWRVLGEGIGARLHPSGGASRSPLGVALTGGVTPAEDHEVLLRFDHYDPDAATDAPDDRWALGYAYTVGPSVQARAEYEAAADDLGNGAVTLRLQVAVN